MKFCILGGGGSFGLQTAKYLLDHDASRVISIGRAAPKLECFTLGIGEDDLRYSYFSHHVGYELDLLMETLDKEWPDVIINFAAQGEGAASLKHSWRYFDTNCTALARLTEELGKRKYLKRFIHIGTSELYGSSTTPCTEDAPLNPTSPYAIPKAAFDQHLVSIYKHLKFPMNILRPSNAYGPGQQLYRLIPKAVLCGLTGNALPLHGGGVAEKSYIHTRDMASAIMLVADKAPLGEIYNVGPERYIAVHNVVRMVAHALGVSFEKLCKVVPDRQHQDSRYWIDSKKIRLLGWKPEVTWNEGLEEMVEWGRKYLPVLKVMPTEFQMRA